MRTLSSSIDPKNPRHILAVIIMIMTLFYIFGLPALNLLNLTEEITVPLISKCEYEQRILSQIFFNTLVMIGSVFLWLKLVHNNSLVEILKSLRLREVKNTHLAVVYGISTALFFMLGMMFVMFLIYILTGFKQENRLALWIGESLSWIGILIVSVFSAFSEEIFFRGYLQERIGLFPAAILFGFAHISYQNIVQVVAAAAFGILLGFLLIRTKNLYSTISAHFSFNLIQLTFIKIVTASFQIFI